MEWSLTQNKLLAFHRLMRTDKPIGALLLLWPTLWALWVATPGIPPLWILAVFVAGVWLMIMPIVNLTATLNGRPAVRCRAATSAKRRRERCLSCWCCFLSCWC